MLRQVDLARNARTIDLALRQGDRQAENIFASLDG
jgi:hypothetical protein